MDADNGFGGLASQILQHLSDEYPRKTQLVFPVLPAQTDYTDGKSNRLVNIGLVLESVFENSSIFSPLSLDCSWASSRFRKFKQLLYKVLF